MTTTLTQSDWDRCSQAADRRFGEALTARSFPGGMLAGVQGAARAVSDPYELDSLLHVAERWHLEAHLDVLEHMTLARELRAEASR